MIYVSDLDRDLPDVSDLDRDLSDVSDLSDLSDVSEASCTAGNNTTPSWTTCNVVLIAKLP